MVVAVVPLMALGFLAATVAVAPLSLPARPSGVWVPGSRGAGLGLPGASVLVVPGHALPVAVASATGCGGGGGVWLPQASTTGRPVAAADTGLCVHLPRAAFLPAPRLGRLNTALCYLWRGVSATHALPKVHQRL
eukprot:TRINITY_DN1531_c0_g1_i13.p4 TRINITY_DN1531_c0_g1~~TRINITY_DN1531_c0_g1_i13.p4  ORF type:complete len:135 (-),score=1.29 TRINITY_DN1531_c0_g1_i13:874-1278(-)